MQMRSSDSATAAPPGRPAARRKASPTSSRRQLVDRLARWFVTAGGIAIIASILGILLFILIEVWPLTRGARIETGAEHGLAQLAPAAILVDEHRSHVASLDTDGAVRVHRLADGARVLDEPLLEEADSPGSPTPLARIAPVPGAQQLAALTADGRLVLAPIDWRVEFIGRDRHTRPVIGERRVMELEDPDGEADGGPIGAFAIRDDEDGQVTAFTQRADGSVRIVRRELEENEFTGEVEEDWSHHGLDDLGETLGPLVMDGQQSNVYAAVGGELRWWRLRRGGRPRTAAVDPSTGAPISTLSLLIGDRSLVVGRTDGTVEIWFPVRQDDDSFRLTPIRTLGQLPDAVRLLAPSLRDKGVLAVAEGGAAELYYSTSERRLWSGEAPLAEATAAFYAPKSDAVYLAEPGRLGALELDNPHPEVSLTAYLGKVWYEGYPEPEYVWQSTGGTDDFEPKLSLAPLMVGTLKGTIYSLLLAIPLGVFGAMYASQFMHASLRRYVKPTVEVMAALPSVVLGFLAGLWLAPRVERAFPSLVLMVLVLPAMIVAAGWLWARVPTARRDRLPVGIETFGYMAVLAAGAWLCVQAGPTFESWVFGSSYQEWLLEHTGWVYDQRNAVVVGLAMGFAVIPIIFSIAEDAFSNVPRNLVSGSLALGATRWQTVTRVVLPTASPGIFSAIMIGFGRAVGETMIVLMATGNTPVLDWNPFNGFRTLSANIAVEIPEAPQGATLYRTLFLAALILFLFTFLINTAAELVRQRLRRRYSQM